MIETPKYPINELTPELKTFLFLRHSEIRRYVLWEHTTPLMCEHLEYTVDNGINHVTDTVFWDQEPTGYGDMYFERSGDKRFNFYIVNAEHISIVEFCTFEFMYYLNKTINPNYDEAFKIILGGAGKQKKKK